MATYHGDNTNNVFAGSNSEDEIFGNGGHDTLSGYGGNDYIAGNAGADSLIGGDGDDWLFSDLVDPAFGYPYHGISYDTFAEADTLIGGAGTDYIFAGYGDSVDGGADTDTLYVSFMGATSGVTADFRLLFSQGSITVGGGVISNIENVYYLEGSNFDDFLVAAYAGHYTTLGPVYARGGNDHVIGTYYTGSVFGGDGDDLIDMTKAQYGRASYGEDGGDTLLGGDAGNQFYGGIGNDYLTGGSQSDFLYGQADDDTIDGGTHGDYIEGGDGNDIIYGAGDNDNIYGGDGDDTIYGDFSLLLPDWGDPHYGGPDAAFDMLHGDAGNDILYGDEQGDTLDGGTGNDTLTGGEGADDLIGGAGSDTFRDTAAGLSGDAIHDFETGDVIVIRDASLTNFSFSIIGNVLVYSGGSVSFVTSVPVGLFASAAAGGGVQLSASIPTILGSAADDVLTGTAGDDRIDGLAGADAMSGDTGNDTFVVDNLADAVIELAEEGTDEIQTALGTGSTLQERRAAMYQLTAADVEILTGTSDLGQGLRGNSGDNIINAAAGDDYVDLTDGGSDDVSSGDGRDVLYFGSAFDAGDSNDAGGEGGDARGDLLVVQGDYSAELILGADALVNIEKLRVLKAENTSFGHDGTGQFDYFLKTVDANVAAGGLLVVQGGSLQLGETLIFNGSDETDGRFQIFGGRDADQLFGGSGDDHLLGRAGDDTLIGNGGNDRLRGGLGRDILVGAGDADIYVYAPLPNAPDNPYTVAALESTGLDHDVIATFDFAEDKIDLPQAVASLNEVLTGALSSASFDADLAIAIDGALQANGAVLFTADAGDRATETFLVIDADGNGVYQANLDFVMELENTLGAAPATPDFFV